MLLTLFSCNGKSKLETKTLDFGNFNIDVPVTWQQVKANGLDSYVGLMILDKGDTVSFDLGWYSNSLEEEYKFMIDDGDVFLRRELAPDSGAYEFYGKADTVDLKKFKVNNISRTAIDGRQAKIIQPKMSGKGMTGIYFDSLWVAGSGIDRFQMNGKNLDPDNEKRLLRAFATLKFRK
jgi:hypothetical protein